MSNQPLNNLNLNNSTWNLPATGVQSQMPGSPTPMLVTPTYDATNLTGGLPNSGAQAMNANSAAPTGNWYADWFSQWSNTMQNLNSTIQGGAMPMDATTNSSYNYTPTPSYYNPNYINTYQGATPMEAPDPNQINQNGDIVIPEADTDADGNLNVTVGTKMDATGQLIGQNATIDSTAKDQAGSISSVDGNSIANTITLKASDKDSGGNKVDISADAKDTIMTQGEGWTAKKNDDGTITLTQKTDGGKENTYTVTPQKGTKVMVNGKDINSTSIFQGDDVPANGLATGKPGDTDTSTLYGQLNGKSSADIAKVDMSDNATVKLSDDQKKTVAQQYALAYTKEKLGDAGKDLKVGDLTTEQLKAAADAATSLTPANDALATAVGDLKSTAISTSDDMIKQLQAGKVEITDKNYDKVDFKKIMSMDPKEAQKIIENMDIKADSKNLSEEHKDWLALTFAAYANNSGVDGVQGFVRGIGIDGEGDLTDHNVSADDLHDVRRAALRCNQPELARIIDQANNDRTPLAKSVGGDTSCFLSGSTMGRDDLLASAEQFKDGDKDLAHVIDDHN